MNLQILLFISLLLLATSFCHASTTLTATSTRRPAHPFLPLTRYRDDDTTAASSQSRIVKRMGYTRGGATTSADTITIPQRLLAGGAARAVAQMTLYPIDALRTLAQTRNGRTVADVGATALIRGASTTSAFFLFMGSIQFAVFGVCRARRGIPTIVSSALRGAAASVYHKKLSNNTL